MGPELNILHLGSGGGSGYYYNSLDNSLRSHRGGNGGGCLKLQCFGNIVMAKDSKISCNGHEAKGCMAGAGSGGSIHIIAKNKECLQMDDDARIQALGGRNKHNFGHGGDGRVRVEFLTTTSTINSCYYHNITPRPY